MESYSTQITSRVDFVPPDTKPLTQTKGGVEEEFEEVDPEEFKLPAEVLEMDAMHAKLAIYRYAGVKERHRVCVRERERHCVCGSE